MELIDTGKCIVCGAFFLTISFLFLSSCESNTHQTAVDAHADSDGIADQTENDPAIMPDDDSVADIDVADDDTLIIDNSAPDADLPGDCDTTNLGKNCKTDIGCGACLICANARCSEGCTNDGDCDAYPGTICNKKLARCLNIAASDGACNETNCTDGCCYAAKGFRSLECASTATLATCGVCKQGEIYMDGKQCVPAACSTGDTLCQTYNAYDLRPTCFTCKTGDLICYGDPACLH
ncbi:MAG TPA: hypothetical protein PKH10_10100 [bacterium]|nr:hypothetical protein [bacterium]